MIEPLISRRTSVNPFKKDSVSGRLIKRVSRAVSGQHGEGREGGGTNRSTTAAHPVQTSSEPPVSLHILPPLSPTLPMPSLSPCPSYRSSKSATSSRSISRKPAPELDFSLLPVLDNTCFSSPTSTSEGFSEEESRCEWRDEVKVEIVDGLWTSTVDERKDWPLPSWYTSDLTSSPPVSSKTTRIARLTNHHFTKTTKSKPRRNFTPLTIPDPGLTWIMGHSLDSPPPPSFESISSHREMQVNPSTLSNRSSRSFSTSTTSPSSPSSPSSSDRSFPSRVNSPFPRSAPPDRKSLFRIESGAQPMILNSSRGGCTGDEFYEEDSDEEEVLVIRMPSST
ncbi:hypothetical protein JCM5350_006219 [Sporobolomyces pararoseus]